VFLITGSGTTGSPYVINSTGGGGEALPIMAGLTGLNKKVVVKRYVATNLYYHTNAAYLDEATIHDQYTIVRDSANGKYIGYKAAFIDMSTFIDKYVATYDQPNNKFVGTEAALMILHSRATNDMLVDSAGYWVNRTPSAVSAILGVSGVSSISLATPNVIFSTPVNFSNSSGAWTATLALNTQTTNKVFAAPNGSTGTPTFRALVAADIPDLSGTYLTTSSAASTYQPLDGDLTALAALTGTDNIYYRFPPWAATPYVELQ
jgi:hypothetical protein